MPSGVTHGVTSIGGITSFNIQDNRKSRGSFAPKGVPYESAIGRDVTKRLIIDANYIVSGWNDILASITHVGAIHQLVPAIQPMHQLTL